MDFYEGGYLETNDSSQSHNQSSSDDKVNQATKSVRSVTIHQALHSQVVSPADSTLYYDNQPIIHIRLVAVVRWISEKRETGQQFLLEDGTGSIYGKVYNNSPTDHAASAFDDYQADHNNESSSSDEEPVLENEYYAVFGKLSRFNERTSLVIIAMKRVTDPHDVVYHQLKAIQEHLRNTLGAPKLEQGIKNPGNNTNSHANGNDLFYSHSGSGYQGNSDLPNRILHYLNTKGRMDSNGVHFETIARELNEDVQVVLTTLQMLNEKGDIYEPADSHYYPV